MLTVKKTMKSIDVVLLIGLLSFYGCSSETEISSKNEKSIIKNKICVGYGPQTPRDIDNKIGENKRIFSLSGCSYTAITAFSLCYKVRG